jgi:two-component system, NtrC family, sensor kinase
MKLGVKIVGVVLVAFALSLGLIVAVQRMYVAPSFHELEREEALRDLDRVVGALDRELTQLGVSAADWAYWDETYRFAASGGADSAYLDTNLNLSAVATLGVQLIAVYDLQGVRLAGFTVDIETEAPIDLGDLSSDRLGVDHPLLRLRGATDGAWGILVTPSGVVLAASRHVLSNEREGPPAGVLVVGRLLDDDTVARLAEQTRVGLAVEPWVEAAATAARVRSGALAHTPPAFVEGPTEIVTSTVFHDMFGQAAMRTIIREPRSIVARGDAAMRTATASTAWLALAIMALLLLVLNRLVIVPLNAVTAHVARVGEADDLNARLDLRRGDEIGVLARSFDRMTDRLADARRAVLERSFDAGKAELASGVLHNVGNVITPLVVRLVDLQERVRRAPAADVRTAVDELAVTGGEGDRGRDLRRFVELAGAELAKLATEVGSELEVITRQVGHVQRILGEQERYSRSAPVVEPLRLDELLEEGVRMLSPAMQRGMTVEVDPSVSALEPIRAPRLAIQQVIGNLLINAAEAISARGGGPGRVRVRAERREEGGRALVRLRFEDDGIGLDGDEVARVFERGFSTKARPGSGLGLHWCAITVQALGGTMRIESAGRNEGACMHLDLPLWPIAEAAHGGRA